MIKGDEIVEEIQLYNAAVETAKRYKEQGEEFIDFDDFMDDIEKEYGIQKGQP